MRVGIKYQYRDGTYLPESSNPPFDIPQYTPHSSTRYVNITAVDANKKLLPELYQNREECCGCTACFAVCPKSSISMEHDEEGFLYPVVDASNCVRCYRCIDVCSFKKDQVNKWAAAGTPDSSDDSSR